MQKAQHFADDDRLQTEEVTGAGHADAMFAPGRSAVTRLQRLADAGAAGRRVDVADAAGGADAAAVKHDHLVIRRDLVDQMRRPQHGDAVVAGERMHVLDQTPAGRHVEADGRLVQQQQRRAVQQRARHLDAPAVAAAQPAHLVAAALGQLQPLELDGDAPLRLARAQPVQPREVAQVLQDRQIEVERRLLEDDAHRRQGPRRGLAQVAAADPHGAALAVEQAGQQGEQRRLAGAVRPEQRGERARLDGEGDAVEPEAVAITEAEIVDLEDAPGVRGGVQHRLTA